MTLCHASHELEVHYLWTPSSLFEMKGFETQGSVDEERRSSMKFISLVAEHRREKALAVILPPQPSFVDDTVVLKTWLDDKIMTIV